MGQACSSVTTLGQKRSTDGSNYMENKARLMLKAKRKENKDRNSDQRIPLALTEDIKKKYSKVVSKSDVVKDLIMKTLNDSLVCSHLTQDQIENAAMCMKKVKKGPKETVLRQGDEGDFFYVVTEGSCQVIVDGTVLPDIIGVGEHF